MIQAAQPDHALLSTIMGVPAPMGRSVPHVGASSQVKDTSSSSSLFPVDDAKNQSSSDARDSRGDTRQVLLSKAGEDVACGKSVKKSQNEGKVADNVASDTKLPPKSEEEWTLVCKRGGKSTRRQASKSEPYKKQYSGRTGFGVKKLTHSRFVMKESGKWMDPEEVSEPAPYKSPKSTSEYQQEFPAPGRSRRQVVPRNSGKKLKPLCYMENCSARPHHVNRHVIGKHLPKVFAPWIDMTVEQRVAGIQEVLIEIRAIINNPIVDLEVLLELALKQKLYPKSNLPIRDEELAILQETSRQLTGEVVKKQLTLCPPNSPIVVTHWRIMSDIVNFLGEGQFSWSHSHPKPVGVGSESDAGEIEEGEIPDKAALSVGKGTSSTSSKSSASKSSASKSSASKSNASKTSKPSISSHSASKPANAATASAASNAEPMDVEYTEVSDSTIDIGTPYSDEQYEKRKKGLSECEVEKMCLFVDSHFHLDKLQLLSQEHDLDKILAKGPMPASPVALSHGVINFCHGPVDEVDKALIEEDSRLYFTYGIHPKHAHCVKREDVEKVVECIRNDKYCVGYGEVGLDYSGAFQKYSREQQRVFEDFVAEFVKHLATKPKLVLVIHCRDKKGRIDASNDCLACLNRQVPSELRKSMRIHRHCFNGSLAELERWRQEFPNTMFGFTGLLLRGGRHPDLDKVVQKLPMERILLETDSPYLQAPVHQGHKYNTPYGIEEIAWRVSVLKDVQVTDVIKATAVNAVDFYHLYRS